jgi:hypothetical protein
MIDKGEQRIEKSTDLVTLIRSQARLKIIERFLFSNKQRLLLRKQAEHNLNVDSSSNESSDDFKDLEGYIIATKTDLRLVRGIFSKKTRPPARVIPD